MAARTLTPPFRWARPLLAALAMLLIPAPLTGCDEKPVPEGFERVKIGKQSFILELAIDDEKRTKGLGERAELPENGGMLFVFRRAQRREFIMRDCLIDIDIIFLDPTGRILAMHHMPKEPPRGEGEGVVGDWDLTKAENRRYESRLKRYPSRGETQFVIEVAGGKLEELNLQVGQKIELDLPRLKAMAR